MLSLSIARPSPKHWRIRKIVEAPLPLAHSNALLAVALTLAITALGTVVIQLFLP